MFQLAPLTDACRPACLIAQGVIDSAATRQLAQAVRRERLAGGATVALDSLGGRHISAISLGEAIRQYGFATEVGRYDPAAKRLGPGICASACIYAFMGGVARAVVPGSRVGVHQVDLGDSSASDASDAQLLMALAAYHLEQSGASPELLTLALATPPDQVRWLTDAELVRLRVVTGAPEPNPAAGAGPAEAPLGLEAVIRFRLLGVHMAEADAPRAGVGGGGR